jgi:CRP/FNR family cyclic AMP-dependent transcriptional regulator
VKREGRSHRDPAETEQLVATLPIFAELSAREHGIIASVFSLRDLDDGDALCREGERGTSFFIVARGIIEVYKELPGEPGAPRREKLAEIGPNNVIGQVALIDGKPRSATCVARGPATALECSRDDFDRLFQAGSLFAFKIIDQVVIDLAKRLREASSQLADLYAHPSDTLLLLHEAALDIQQTISA